MTSLLIRPRWGARLATAALAAAGLIGFSGELLADDRIELVPGSSVGGTQLSGNITTMSADAITIEVKGDAKRVPVDDIKDVQFDGEPVTLRLLRNKAETGRYEEGLQDAAKIDQTVFSGSRLVNMQQDVLYYTAYCTTFLALQNAKPLEEAEKLLDAFTKAHPGSYRILKVSELLGDVESQLGKYPEAEKAYGRLTSSTLDSYKLRGAVLVGYTQLKQKKNADATRSFDEVMKSTGTSNAVKRQVFLAKLGKASCLAAEGADKAQEGEKLAREVIKDLPKEESAAIYGRAYNTLGACLEAGGDPAKQKEALLAYLHVDVLYYGEPQEHAEALYHLSKLWKATEPAEADKCAELLKSRYGNSAWAKL